MTSTEQRLWDRFGHDPLNTDQLARTLAYQSVPSVLEAIRRGTFPVRTYLLGKRRVADISDVAAYLDQQKADAA